MPHVTNEEIIAFSESFQACMSRIDGGKVAVDSTVVRKLVRENRAAAERYVEIQCLLGQSNPVMFQGALLLASAYDAEFGDSSLGQRVLEQAKSAGGEEWLRQIGFSQEMPAPLDERPERRAALEWWKESRTAEGHCDNCNRPMIRGEGYLIRGRVLRLGDRRIEMGDELVCEACFRQMV